MSHICPHTSTKHSETDHKIEHEMDTPVFSIAVITFTAIWSRDYEDGEYKPAEFDRAENIEWEVLDQDGGNPPIDLTKGEVDDIIADQVSEGYITSNE